MTDNDTKELTDGERLDLILTKLSAIEARLATLEAQKNKKRPHLRRRAANGAATGRGESHSSLRLEIRDSVSRRAPITGPKLTTARKAVENEKGGAVWKAAGAGRQSDARPTAGRKAKKGAKKGPKAK